MKPIYYILCLIIFFTFSIKIFSQNLVLNGGFENILNCPNNLRQIQLATNWNDALIPESVDLYNTCADSASLVSVPKNHGGHQYPRSGNSYMGFVPAMSPGYREYPQVELNDTLSKGENYKVSFYINRVDKSIHNITDIEIFFSDTLLTVNKPYGNDRTLLYTPSISIPICNLNSCITDTLWHEVSGIFTADGGEKYMILGSFKSDSLTNYIKVNPLGVYDGFACFIDDISLVKDTTTSIFEHQYNDLIKLYPNPSNGNFTLELPVKIERDKAVIEVFNLQGKKVKEQKLLNKMQTVIFSLTPGFYFYNLKINGKVLKSDKLVISE